MASHCLSSGQLGTNELPVPNISGATITTFNPPTGMSIPYWVNTAIDPSYPKSF